MNIKTEILHIKNSNCEAKPSVTPIYQCSAFDNDSAYFYSRKANPNVEEFEKLISKLEGSNHSLAYGTGMTAINMVLNLLKPNSSLVINKYIYGCSYKLFQKYAKWLNISLTIIDLSKEDSFDQFPAKIDMVFFETPTNPFLKTVDVMKVSKRVKQLNPNALIVVDNTWATPIFQRPLGLGADISLYSATKYFSGHSDVMGGVVTTDRKELYDRLADLRFYAGTIITPHSAWLLTRSMKTFYIRMEKHSQTTKVLVNALKDNDLIEKIYYPYVDGQQLKGYGGIIFAEVAEIVGSNFNDFAKQLQWFGTGTGMACVTSMIAQPYTGSHASMSDEEKADMGIKKNLIRLCFGLEDQDDLAEDLNKAFRTYRKKVVS